MNRMMRGVGLLMLGMAAGCVADVGQSSEAEPGPSVPKAARSAPAQRDRAPFSRVVREQLAARGIHVHDGSKPQGERTTVEQDWKVQFHPMQRVETNNPTNVPHRYAVQLSMRAPRSFVAANKPNEIQFDYTLPGLKDECSGALVGSTAVLTAAHCYIQWVPYAVDPVTRVVSFKVVKMYSIDASPRRNGSNFPVKPIPVKKSYWDFANWPGAAPPPGSRPPYPMDHDYAVLRFKTAVPSSIPPASRRVIASPSGKTIDTAHYPFQKHRGFRMFYSIGDLGGLVPNQTRTYQHNASSETDSSGSGIFEAGVDGVAGVNVGEVTIPGMSNQRVPDQTLGPAGPAGGRPNNALMLTAATDANISAWIAAIF